MTPESPQSPKATEQEQQGLLDQFASIAQDPQVELDFPETSSPVIKQETMTRSRLNSKASNRRSSRVMSRRSSIRRRQAGQNIPASSMAEFDFTGIPWELNDTMFNNYTGAPTAGVQSQYPVEKEDGILQPSISNEVTGQHPIFSPGQSRPYQQGQHISLSDWGLTNNRLVPNNAWTSVQPTLPNSNSNIDPALLEIQHTPGLSAIPGGDGFSFYESMEDHSTSEYPEPSQTNSFFDYQHGLPYPGQSNMYLQQPQPHPQQRLFSQGPSSQNFVPNHYQTQVEESAQGFVEDVNHQHMAAGFQARYSMIGPDGQRYYRDQDGMWYTRVQPMFDQTHLLAHSNTAVPVVANPRKRARSSLTDEADTAAKRCRTGSEHEDVSDDDELVFETQDQNRKRKWGVDSSDDDDDEEPSSPRNKRSKRRNGGEDSSNNDKQPRSPRSRRFKRRNRRGSVDSGMTGSSLGNIKPTIVVQAGELPQKDESKPWVRNNTATRGETTRTAKINLSQRTNMGYKYTPLPHGNWSSTNYDFEYHRTEFGLDVFQKRMSAKQIKEYITEYPSDNLVLWIQYNPTDRAKRYATYNQKNCLFKKCPKAIYETGSIQHGHYRIAFDEKFKVHGNNKRVDPFDCPGFAHLYCMERFMDFSEICKVADVRVDTRVDFPRELNEHPLKFSPKYALEVDLAKFFIRAAQKCKTTVRETELFKNYPVHPFPATREYSQHMLVGMLNRKGIEARSPSQLRQFVVRELSSGCFLIHQGDLEIAMTKKKIMNSRAYKSFVKKHGGGAEFDFRSAYDDYDPIINQRWDHYHSLYAVKGKTTNKPKLTTKSPAPQSTSRKRKAYLIEESEDEEPDLGNDSDKSDDEVVPDPRPKAKPARSSPRKKPRINYTVEDLLSPTEGLPALPNQFIDFGVAPGPAHHTTRANNPNDPNPSPPLSARKASASHLFPKVQLTGKLVDYDEQVTKSTAPRRTPPPLTQEEIENVLGNCSRRKSSGSSARSTRQASFNRQPVSESLEYHTNDPPTAVGAASPKERRRRSPRLASVSSLAAK